VLREIKLVDCKVFGMRGPVLAHAVEISNADASPVRDVTIRADPDTVLRQWQA
jgi:hypothetical protein